MIEKIGILRSIRELEDFETATAINSVSVRHFTLYKILCKYCIFRVTESICVHTDFEYQALAHKNKMIELYYQS